MPLHVRPQGQRYFSGESHGLLLSGGMIISRTPFRISFFGGGTDYNAWYQANGGAVLSTTINHYCYLTCRFLPPFFKKKSRIVWSKTELVMENSEIEHPAVRAVLEYFPHEQKGVEIIHSGDLPARAGLGSSSAFTVGLLNAMHALQGRMSNKRELACEAVHIERDILKENVGVQDQIATAYGGFNKINILPNGEFSLEPVVIPQGRLQDLQSHFLLFYTGVSRNATDVVKEQLKTLDSKKTELDAMRQMVDEALNVLRSGADLSEFGRLLHESWQIKRTLSPGIAPGFVDDIYRRAREAGAIGGKLLGAGGGGYLLLYVPFSCRHKVTKTLNEVGGQVLEFRFEPNGVQTWRVYE